MCRYSNKVRLLHLLIVFYFCLPVTCRSVVVQISSKIMYSIVITKDMKLHASNVVGNQLLSKYTFPPCTQCHVLVVYP